MTADQSSADHPFDILVIGGGINGAGVARDAAGRGWRVLLCEQGDLAGATSSASTKLIHGGLRYLEYFQFRLVRESLAERETLLRIAPHLVRPLRFIMPHHGRRRAAWMIRIGLWLYDRLGGRRSLPGSASVDLTADIAGQPLKPDFRAGFSYSDCWADDARLVLANAQDAAAKGAAILTRTACLAAERRGALWHARLRDVDTGAIREVVARTVVNAAGPWVRRVAVDVLGLQPASDVRLVKGSHIVTRKLFDGEHAYLFQNDDQRVVFAIPFGGDFTLIGTTDVPYAGDPAQANATPAEIDYLCRAASHYLRVPIRPNDVVWSFSGVRPLHDDGKSDPKAVSRDYVLELDHADGAAAALSVYGGKLTTYRRLAEEVLDNLAPHLPPAGGTLGGTPWTASRPLPGGDLGGLTFADYVARLAGRYPNLDRRWLGEVAGRHGGRSEAMLGEARSMADLGRDFGGGLYAREVDWMRRNEWARTTGDVLWRRSKCGLRIAPESTSGIAERLQIPA
jgi:glycerol-3-phosphate dehydrogenase